MDTQGLSEGSLRSSHRETHAIRRKPAPASFHELARKLVESCSQDLIVRQRLDPERSEGLLKKNPFFVLENEGRADPGFLVFLPGKPALYHQLRKGRPPQTSTLRMRVSATLGEGGGSILIATLDDVGHTLRLEDVWMWRGESVVQKKTFSERRGLLKEFVERHWVPDARLLGGIFTTVAQPISLEEFAQKGTSDTCHSVEFIPDAAGRRRLVVYKEEIARAASGPAGLKQLRTAAAAPPAQERNTIVAAPAGAPAPSPPLALAGAPTPSPPVALAGAPTPSPAPPAALMTRRVRAVPVEKMPDVYNLFGEDGFPISRASVQKFSLSQQIREAVARRGEAWVQATWRPEFGGYEIAGLA